MKSINRLQALACGVAIFALAACTDVWDEHYQPDPVLNAEENLWQLIEKDPELQDFAAFLVATKYDSLLMMNRNYTVWAPTDCDSSLLRNATDSLLKVYRKEIVENHIADYSHVATGVRNREDSKNYKKVTMLNGKMYHFEGSSNGGYTFSDNCKLTQSNIVAKNGVLHKLDGSAKFSANIWEQLPKEAELDSLWKFLSKDFSRTLDKDNSIYGPAVEGKKAILDTVWKEECRWFSELGYLNEEDSSYVVYALSNKAWDEMYDMTKKYFKYSKTLVAEEGGKSSELISDSVVKELMCRNLVFSATINKKFYDGERDTLISNYRYGRQIFKGEDARAITEDGIIKEIPLSNGVLNIVNQVNYNPLTCWHDTIRIQGESLNSDERYSDDDDSNDNYGKGFIRAAKNNWTVRADSTLRDSISGGYVGVFEADYGTFINPVFNFYIDNVLSAKYRIKLVLFPPKVIDPEATFVKPNKFEVELCYVNANGESKSAYLTPDEEHADSKYPGLFLSDPTKIDTIILADCFEFPACEANLSGINASEKVQAKLHIVDKIDWAKNECRYAEKTEKWWKFDNTYRIDEIILEPLPADYESEK